MHLRKPNPDRKLSAKKLSSPQPIPSQFSSTYKEVLKATEIKHSDDSISSFVTSALNVMKSWDEQSPQTQSICPRHSVSRIIVSVLNQQGIKSLSRLKLARTCLQVVHKMDLASLLSEVSRQKERQEKGPQIASHCKSGIQSVIRCTQDTKNDRAVVESGIIKVVFQLLASLYELYAANVQKLEKKLPSFQRKSSLKKQEVPTFERPKSRQKLSSLTKRQPKPIASMNSTLASIAPSIKEQSKEQSLEDIVLGLLTVVKNCSANTELRKKILEQQCLTLLNKYIQLWNDKNITTLGNKMLIQLTSTHRHLAAEQKSFKSFLAANTVEQWIRLLQTLPTSKQIVLNLLRLFSKFSTIEQCCALLDSRQICIRNLIRFFATYKTDIYIIIRVSFIFANMTSYLVDIRNKMYFQYNAFSDIYLCFDFYVNSQLKGKSQIDQMGLTTMGWDYQTMKKESDIEALVKIIRLIANLFTINEIGMDIYLNKGIQFKDMVKKLKILLEKKIDIECNPDLIICGLSLLANSLYYDKEVIMSNVEHKNTKIQIINLLASFIVQTQNQQVCCEGLRVLSNLSRSKEFIKFIIEAQLHQATIILLESSSKEIVYYSLGVIINLLVDQEFKKSNREKIVRGVLDILSQCNNEDFDIITICSKCVSNVAKGLTGPLVKEIQNTMQRLGSRCDSLMFRPSSATKQELQQSRKMINLVINDLTDDPFVCKIGDCGRRFESQLKLKEHADRRHKL